MEVPTGGPPGSLTPPARSILRVSLVTTRTPHRDHSRRPAWHRHLLAAGGTGILALLASWVYSTCTGPTTSAPSLMAAITAPGDATAEAAPGSAKTAAAPKPPDFFKKTIAPFLKTYCFECHGPETDNGGLRFDTFVSSKDVTSNRKTWAKTLQYLELGAMPPPDHDTQPDAKTRQAVVGYLDKTLFDIDCDLIRDPGRVTIRRLNRAEYDNTIRDLLGVDFHPARNFPSDDVGEGFDNIGDVLSVSPLLIEKYLDAAEQVAEKTIVPIDPFTSRRRKLSGGQLNKNAGVNAQGSSFGLFSKGHVGAVVEFPTDGEYVLRVNASADQAGPDPARLTLSIDNKPVKTLDIKSKNRDDRQNHEHKLKVSKGRRPLQVAFINDYYKPKDPDPKLKGDRNAYIHSLEVIGPLEVKPEDLPESHRKLVRFRPDKSRTALEAARANLTPLMRRAFRRPVTQDEVDPIARFVADATADDEPFEAAMQIGLQAVLVSPHFLFRVEHGTPHTGSDAKGERTLTDFELASRLSYFLWSSLPDDELFRLAEQKRLSRPDVLAAQVRRMLADPRSKALVENFASQWLNLRILDELTPDPKQFPEFNDELRKAMQQETSLFFAEILHKNLPVTQFLDGRFTFVNASLAKLYGIPGIEGNQMRRIDLAGDRRAGVLTQASILTLTSNPDRTSPVKRGKWIMDNILDTPPPQPPPDVPGLEIAAKTAPDASLRKQLELHRQKATCAICHRQMDALGFGFENFDAIGRWRDSDGKHKIDPSGQLPGKQSFSSPIELIEILRKREDRFCRSLSRKMLVYSLGRGLEFNDRCAVDRIVTASRSKGYRFQALVVAITLSDPFRMRRTEGVRP